MTLSPLRALLTAQFLSAFVDNMILFLVRGILIANQAPDYYLSFVQGTFLLAYIILAPIVGAFADRQPKAKVLLIGNGVKALGVLAMMMGLNPAFSYAIVGVGAVIYSPAKYGLLPWLTKSEPELLKANAHLEGTTILAILSGAIVGGMIADISPWWGLVSCMVLYGASMLFTYWIPWDAGNAAIQYGTSIRMFWSEVKGLFFDDAARFSLIGTSSFWMVTAVLRLILFVWVPWKLGIDQGIYIGGIIGITGIGVAVGAILTPKLISLEKYTKTLYYGLAMGVSIFSFLWIDHWMLTSLMLFVIGVLGGVYIVPMNACLQRVGHKTIGAGKTIAVQNLFENVFMCVGVFAYMEGTRLGASINQSIGIAGIAFLLIILIMGMSTYWRKWKMGQ